VSGNALGPKILRVPLAKANTSGTTQTSGTVVARIRNPSRKLGCGFQIHFEVHQADGRTVNTFDGAPGNLWTTRVYDPEGGHLLHEIQSSVTIPRQYEMETFAPGVQVTAVLGLARDIAAAAIAGTWVLTARWEPVVPMCDDEVRALYAQCAATLERGLAIPLAP
jgi:hypothetical protein